MCGRTRDAPGRRRRALAARRRTECGDHFAEAGCRRAQCIPTLWFVGKKCTCGGFSYLGVTPHGCLSCDRLHVAPRRATGARGDGPTRDPGTRHPNSDPEKSIPRSCILCGLCAEILRVSSGRTAVKPRRESMRERARREPEYTAAPTTYRHGLGLGFRHVTPVRDLSARPPLPRAITAR